MGRAGGGTSGSGSVRAKARSTSSGSAGLVRYCTAPSLMASTAVAMLA